MADETEGRDETEEREETEESREAEENEGVADEPSPDPLFGAAADAPPPPPPPLIEPEPVTDEDGPLVVLLKAPGVYVERVFLEKRPPMESLVLLASGLAFHLVFGLAMGFFGGWESGFMAACKAPLVALFAAALCLPSLYVFSCVSGLPMNLSRAFSLAAATVASTGLMLIGLAPVTWLFSVSTENLGFIAVLNLMIWLLAVGFSFRVHANVSSRCRRSLLDGVKKSAGLKLWLAIYIVVSMQMTTTMRPLLVKPETGWFGKGKRFFVAHFLDAVSGKSEKSKSDKDSKDRSIRTRARR